jgi:deoxyribodipyrimidine photo-lyase
MSTAIWWIRRDLRLQDNLALSSAIKRANQVIPVFVRDPALLNSTYVGEKRLAFLYAGLRALEEDLRQKGSSLVVRTGDPGEVLSAILRESGAEAIFAEEDFSPYARLRDQRVSRALPLHLTAGLSVHHPDTVRKADGSPYTVFTPFSKAWLALPESALCTPAPDRIASPAHIHSEGIPAQPQLPSQVPFIPGEQEARQRLARFTAQVIDRYGSDRNRMDLEGTSGLSPYLRFGMLSACQATQAARQAILRAADKEGRRSAETWLNELIWREFYISVLYHFPFARRSAFRPSMRAIAWANDPQDFSAWTQGKTGYPVVDAAMRQLLETGWMHNRARMITASFLTKDLLIDWRWGERHFMQHLVDGDPAANNGGWQWTAGTGTDAAPYFRIFNPILQSMKFDPQGAYIRRFVPELANVPDQFIHSPWQMDLSTQRKSGCQVGKDYPAPIVDHTFARERTLHAYKV